MREKERVKEVLRLLNELYPHTRCYLDYNKPYELLFATILSAQCTDDRVNIVTKDLFAKYPTLEDYAGASLEELESVIHSTGFYKNKAQSLKETAALLLSRHGGEVPSDIEALTNLRGVGRKTANVVRGNIYKIPSIVVDTHVMRVSQRLGLTKEDDAVKIEFDLMKKLPQEAWIDYNFQIIAHGRAICTAKQKRCQICPMTHVCQLYTQEASRQAKNRKESQ